MKRQRGRAPLPSRVLLVTQSTTVGGMERHCVELAAELVARGSAVTAVLPRDPVLDPLACSLERGGAQVERINTDARSGRYDQVQGVLRFIRLARRFEPEVVHLHVGGATGGLGVVLAARLAIRAVVVTTEHDVPDGSPAFRHRVARSLLDRSVHTMIAVSRHNAHLRAQRLGVPKGRLAVVLNGTRLPAETAPLRAANRVAVRAELNIPAGRVVLGTVARLVEGKGLDTLLRAFAEVRRSRDVQLLVVGGGPLESELRLQARELGVEDSVLMVGHKAEPGRFVDAMDVFVLAVPLGSGSIALLEAMARATPPVITFGNGEEAVVSGKTGLWAPPNDPVALGVALTRLSVDADLRRRLGAAAEAHVRKHYSIRRVVDDMVNVYSEARSRRVPRGLRLTDAADRQPGARAAHAPAP